MKSTVCTVSSTRPSAITVAHVPLLPVLVGVTFPLFSPTSQSFVGEFSTSLTTRGAEAQASPAQVQPARQTLLDARLPVLVRLEAGSLGGDSRDRGPLASCRLPSVLALEIKTARWPSKDPAGNPSAHSRDESRQPIVGRTTDSWRASQARHGCRTNHRCKVYGEGKANAVPRVEDVPG